MERRDLATLEGMDEVSEVIKLVIKLYNRGGGEGGEGCPEEFHFPADLLVESSGSPWWFFFFFLIPSFPGLERKSG